MNISEAEHIIENSPHHRLLRRVPAPENWRLQPAQSETRRCVLVDCETTGLDPDRDEVIELALIPFDYERASGRITSVDVAAAVTGFREPSFLIPPESTRVHGITPDMVRGHTIDAEAIRAVIEPAHLIIAHNAGFDRPMLEKHWPLFENKHWACSLTDIDWAGAGVSSQKLDYLLFAQGWFHDGHRALSDALATLFLMTLPLPGSEQFAFAALLECARRPLWAVRAEDTAFEQRAALRARGYRWDDGEGRRPRAWWILTQSPQEETAWLRSEIYGDDRDVKAVHAPATRRYSARLWPD